MNNFILVGGSHLPIEFSLRPQACHPSTTQYKYAVIQYGLLLCCCLSHMKLNRRIVVYTLDGTGREHIHATGLKDNKHRSQRLAFNNASGSKVTSQ